MFAAVVLTIEAEQDFLSKKPVSIDWDIYEKYAARLDASHKLFIDAIYVNKRDRLLWKKHPRIVGAHLRF